MFQGIDLETLDCLIMCMCSSLKDGFQTNTGDRGLNLSRGQKQRIAIARAFLKNPRILLLDEATSALDAESEQKIQIALEEVKKRRTTIIIAHRLCTIQNCNNIVILENGEVREQGTHAQLLAKPEGTYLSMINLQKNTSN